MQELTREEEREILDKYVNDRFTVTPELFKDALGKNKNNRLMALLELEDQGYMYLVVNGERKSLIYWTQNIEEMEQGNFTYIPRSVEHAENSTGKRRKYWFETE